MKIQIVLLCKSCVYLTAVSIWRTWESTKAGADLGCSSQACAQRPYVQPCHQLLSKQLTYWVLCLYLLIVYIS